MEYRDLVQTGMRVSEISLGTWAFGDGWGKRAREIYASQVRDEVHHQW